MKKNCYYIEAISSKMLIKLNKLKDDEIKEILK